jgi:hypothetical protein
MKDYKKLGGFLGAMTAFSPAFFLGGVHYAISSLDGKAHSDASEDFKRTFGKVFDLGEQVGAELTDGIVSAGSKIFNDEKGFKEEPVK